MSGDSNDYSNSLPDTFGNVVFCDDLRFETSNKVIAIGIYAGGMHIHSDFPAQVKSFAMLVNYHERIGTRSSPVSILFYFPGEDEPIAKIILPLEQIRQRSKSRETDLVDPSDPDSPKANFHIATVPVVMGPVVFKKPGLVIVLAQIGDEMLRLGALNVRRARETAGRENEATLDAGESVKS